MKLTTLCAAVATSLTIVLPAGPANAFDTVTVKAGSRSVIHRIGVYNTTNCSSAPYAKISAMNAKNGTVTNRKSKGKFTSGVCKGRTIKSIDIIYKPNSGFRGKDLVTISWSFPQYSDQTALSAGRSSRITVNVK